MAIITKTIGSGGGRNYSTVTAWEADLDSGAAGYAAGDTAVGDMYDDATFSESPTINGGGTLGLAAITLKAATGEGHTGIADGAVISGTLTAAGNSTITTTLQQLRITAGRLDAGTTWRVTCKRCIVHNFSTNVTGTTAPSLFRGNDGGSTNAGAGAHFLNCMGWRMTQNGGGTRTANGMYLANGTRVGQAYNCTIYGVTSNGSTNNLGINGGSSTQIARNCIAGGVTNTSSGTPSAFSGGITQSFNLADDTTAGGTGAIDNAVMADTFVSTTNGSEDLHLKSGSAAINAGTDLATSPSGVEIDIDGRDRDAQGDTWDIGADEYVSTGYSMVAAGGSFTISGTAATLKRAKKVAAASGAFAVTGTAASLERGLKLAAGGGAFTVSGIAASFRRALKIAAGSGAYAIGGAAASLERGLKLVAGSGSYQITGTAATLRRGRTLIAAAGAYTVSGTAAGLRATRRIIAGVGTFAINGTAASLERALRLTAGAGSYVVTGIAATLTKTSTQGLSADPGSYVVTGTAAGLRPARHIAAGVGAYAITGVAASLERGLRLTAGGGSYTVVGAPAGLEHGRRLFAGSGSVTLAGAAASLERSLRLVAGSGAVVFTGTAAVLTVSIIVPPPAGLAIARERLWLCAITETLAVSRIRETLTRVDVDD